MGKHEKTLDAIRAKPTRANIKWNSIESLLLSKGAEMNERAGSRVIFVLNDRKALVHRPHPSPEAPKGLVDEVRKFLQEAGEL